MSIVFNSYGKNLAKGLPHLFFAVRAAANTHTRHFAGNRVTLSISHCDEAVSSGTSIISHKKQSFYGLLICVYPVVIWYIGESVTNSILSILK